MPVVIGSYEDGFDAGARKMLINIAEWMQADVDWLEHIQDRRFKCGCRPYDEDYNYCEEWKAYHAVVLARKRLLEAQEKLDKALEQPL